MERRTGFSFGPADAVSLCNLSLGFLAMLASIESRFWLAAVLLLAAGACDYLDGRIARALGRTSQFGLELDSLADMVSFVIAPLVFAYMAGLRTWPFIMIFVLYAAAGGFRLARYNTKAGSGHVTHYEGVPVTMSMFFPAIYVVFSYAGIPLLIWALLYPAHAVLMVSTLKVRKL